MKGYIKNVLLSAVIWFVVSILLSAALRFIVYLLSVEWSYKTIFWYLYPWGLLGSIVVLTIAHIFFLPWLRVYKRETHKGVRRKVAADTADREVKIRAPRRLLLIFVR